jgi:hypothetical protein
MSNAVLMHALVGELERLIMPDSMWRPCHEVSDRVHALSLSLLDPAPHPHRRALAGTLGVRRAD